jgi:tight adherence protein B
MRPRRLANWLVGLAALAVSVGLLAVAIVPVVAQEATAGVLALQSVDTSAWPQVTMRVGLPASMLEAGALRASDFSLKENGVAIGPLSVRSLEARRRPLDVVLLIDTSGSMEGKALSDAKTAAGRLIAGLAAADRVSVMSFNAQPMTLVSFTSNRSALASAIQSLSAANATALYDALVSAADSFEDSGSTDRAIVLLSDGGDTVSGNTLDSAAASLAAARAPLYAVALQANDLDVGALRTLSHATGGRLVEVADSAGFAAVFGDIAKQLTQPYEVVFTSLRPPSMDLEIDLIVSSRDARAGLSAAVPNPDAVAAVSAPSVSVEPPNPAWPFAIAAFVFVAVGLLVAGVIILTRPEPNTLAHLSFYEQLQGSGTAQGASLRPRNPDDVRGRMVRVAGSIASRSGFEETVRTELERAGLPLRPVEYMMIHAGAVIVGGLLLRWLSGNVMLAALTVVAMAFGPIYVLALLARRRTAAFQAQLPDVLNLLAGSLRAGWGLLQAVGIVVDEVGAPAGPEFARVATEARLGLPLEDALAKMAVRMGSEDFKWAVNAIAIQREVGGNLAEVLDLVADTVRERSNLRQQIHTLTSEGRLSAVILTALPFVEAVGLWVISPGYIGRLFTSIVGIYSAVGAAVLLVAGILWLRRIVRIEV